MNSSTKMNIPTIYGTWVEEPNYDPTKFDYEIRVVQPDGTEVVKKVDRTTFERAASMQLQRRLEEDG